MKSEAQREKELLEWRRSQELEMYSTGKTMTQIAEKLKLDVATVSRDIALIRKLAREKQAMFIEHELPFRHRLRTAAMDKAIKELWALFESESSTKSKKAILDSITDALLKQAAIDGDPAHLEQALKFVSRLKKKVATEEEATA